MYEQLITDDYFMKLASEQKQKGIFDIVGQTHTEHWHSAFVCWLLSPDANHGLGDFPICRLLSLYVNKLESNSYAGCEKLELTDILDSKCDELVFKTEQGINGIAQGSIDILGKSDEYIIVIENKVDADERMIAVDNTEKGQTYIYYDYFSKKEKYKNAKKIYIYLTANDTRPFDEHFMKITYQEFYDAVILKSLKNPEINSEARYLIEQYVCNLRKKSNKTKRALALPAKEECEKLYRKYQNLFDKIFAGATKSKDSDVNSVEFKLYEKYQPVFDEIFLSVKGITPTVNLQGEDLVKYLVMTKRISVNDEFYHKGREGVFEADLKEENGEYYFIVAEKDAWAIGDSTTSDGFAHYKHFKAAAQAVKDEWNRRNGIDASASSIDGTTWWHRGSINGPTPKDLQ